ncbi:deazaflavin-dependent oxidoreductase (nitroreductase family) [Thermosporothrix hazakensis]|uniref:Deazaflavin-dependent oxidoreductase (Nitroreductase family) n=2 Tax=Thermosporothrix TaxID=768650 RepID=A0A326U4U0_THEHA|nr:nitroreductase family deazaflavin-dependent oxidoreductase [Thermosporothrix hazakensis]PZW28068.1 deazaflavin-dependent oxidoreductase (nitroreductase family) [Thermosporothrix hazakensis]BBH87001.1 hypothetical protein KTC_17520 [Thermosporothrix sp. COM3]GCE51290.1 hypothetical protein KTH_61590 [Thermosporothrix hazakensis]
MNFDFVTFNQGVVEEFRKSGGQLKQNGYPLILVTVKGAKTGQPRIYPLMSVPYGEHYLAVASKGGDPKHPLWYHNMLANPDVTVEVGAETYPARARLLSGEERERAFAHAVTIYPPYAEYQEKTTREIPVFVLERQQ